VLPLKLAPAWAWLAIVEPLTAAEAPLVPKIPFARFPTIRDSLTVAVADSRTRPSRAFSETVEWLARATWEELVA
jgi:hypothetical protein